MTRQPRVRGLDHKVTVAMAHRRRFEGRIRSEYLPFRTQVLYRRPRQNDRLRVMLGTSLYRYYTPPHTPMPVIRRIGERTIDTIFGASILSLIKASQIAEIVNGVYGADTVTANYVQFWFRRFRSDIFDVKDAPRTRRPVVENVDKFTGIIQVDRRVSSRNITHKS
ncbi:histone-lysine N-methyltransferase SETMAR [Trichonephila clavipes]|nr:histone-lysine N-methyltransferase SETMAR [Trichonephila clavipes]